MTNITADYFRKTKIKILSPKHSKQVQEAVFTLGGMWNCDMGNNVGYTDSPYMFIYDGLRMTRTSYEDHFNNHEYKEITFPPQQEENVMTEEWKPKAGEEVYVNLYGGKFKTLFIGVQSNGFGVFEVTDEMGKYYDDDVYCSSIPMEKFSPIPKTKLIHGVEVPDISFVPEDGDIYYFPKPEYADFVGIGCASAGSVFSHRVRHNLCYPYTEEGKQAAILHVKAMLGIAEQTDKGE